MISFIFEKKNQLRLWFFFCFWIAGTAFVQLEFANASSYYANSLNLLSRSLVIFIMAYIICQICRDNILYIAMESLEENIENTNKNIFEKIKIIELADFEKYKSIDIYNTLSSMSRVAAQSQGILLKIFSAASSALAAFFAIITLSSILVIAIMFILVPFIFFYIFCQKNLIKKINKYKKSELFYFTKIKELLMGSKELFINKEKSLVFFQQEIVDTVKKNYKKKLEISKWFSFSFIFAEYFTIFLIAFLVFFVPLFFEGAENAIAKSAIILFFLPTRILKDIPAYFDIKSSINKIRLMRDNFQCNSDDKNSELSFCYKKNFEEIIVDSVSFSYRGEFGETNFSLQSISLSLIKGGIYFIVGGNGSGKSTLMKVIAGLYKAEKGKIFLDETPLSMEALRQKVSVIFSEYHLFNTLYGLENLDAVIVNNLLKKMRLENKVFYQNGQFDNIKLSTGQRKRLAMIVAILEEKPILLLDEWAADQDPDFRDFFYTEWLPYLKSLGKTVIVASHDDRYFSIADQVIKMDKGHVVDIYSL